MSDIDESTLRLPEHIRASRPYQPGKPIDALAREIGVTPETIVKLASNENPLGMCAGARAALIEAAMASDRYPDNDCHALVEALSRKLDVPKDWLILGNGSECILGLAATAFLEPRRRALYSQYSFQAFVNAVQRTGAQHDVVAARDYGCDLAALLAAIDDDTALIYIANPGNPTGTLVRGAALERFIKAVPKHIPVLLDEAYYEFLDVDERYDSLAWVRRHENLIVTRTFSKAYGLAGLRVGYGIAQPAIAALLNRIRPPFVVTTCAERAAVAALADDAFLAQSVEVNRVGLAQLCAGFDALQLDYLRSHANFVLVHVGDGVSVNAKLLRQGVIVRPVGAYGLPHWLRISVGTPRENEKCLAALAEAMTG
jgi:histidinol-phosphate aminotransferase